MSVIFFFSAVISVLYYLGWMQVLIQKMALIMQYSLGTSAVESLHAAVNVFVGWVSASAHAPHHRLTHSRGFKK